MDRKFRAILGEVASRLTDYEVKCLIFLAQDTESSLHVDKCKDAHNFLDKLEQLQLLTSLNTSFLKDLLENVGRKDLSDMLPDSSGSSSSGSVRLSKSRTILFRVMGRLSKTECQNLKFYFNMMQNNVVHDALDLAWYLIQSGTLNELQDGLLHIKRNDLAGEMEHYYEITKLCPDADQTMCASMNNLSLSEDIVKDKTENNKTTDTKSLPAQVVEFDGNRGRCLVCDVELTSQKLHDQHVEGRPHTKALKKRMEMEEKTGSGRINYTNPPNSEESITSSSNNMTSTVHAPEGEDQDSITQLKTVAQEDQPVPIGSASGCYSSSYMSPTIGPLDNSFSSLDQSIPQEVSAMEAQLKTTPMANDVDFDEQQHCGHCNICDVKLTSKEVYKKHIEGSRHKKAIRARDPDKNPLYCKDCKLPFTGPQSAEEHFKSSRHIQMKEILKGTEVGQLINGRMLKVGQVTWYVCDICRYKDNSGDKYDTHVDEKHPRE